ncbi:MAG: DUF2281 domain-containing protein [Salinibacter sp.]|jgi:hypothetical protein
MNDPKAKILEALDALPEERQREVLDFVEFLQNRTPVPEEESPEDGKEDLNPEDDPILDAIGSVDADLGSDRIDEILYGK